MRAIAKVGATGAALCLAVQVASAQGANVMHPEGVYTQAPTGMSYPSTVDDFRRVNVIHYKEDGTDESAGYNRVVPLDEINGTVYVFPSPPLLSINSPRSVVEDARNHLCTMQFQTVEHEVAGAHPDATLIQDGPTRLTQGNVSHQGFLASYKLNNVRFFGRDNVESRSDAYVFCFAGGKWTVEYRFDYPVDYDAGEAIAAFMRDLVWTIPQETAN